MNKPGQLQTIIDSIDYLNQFHGNTFLIKVGGSILENDSLIESLSFDLKLLINAGIKLIIVHGGSKAINKQLSYHKLESEFIDGLRVTSFEAMNIIEMVLCGHVNKRIVRKLNHIGISSIGLSGIDNNLFLCDFYSKQHGYTGKITSINHQAIADLTNFTPVIAPIGVNASGEAMNINADYAASYLATHLQVDKLIYLTDQDGIYDKHGEVYSELSINELKQLINDHTVKDGMLIKVLAILHALNNLLNQAHILNGNKKNVLIEELFTVNGVGTLCFYDELKCDNLEEVA